jgi:hypothetical protein
MSADDRAKALLLEIVQRRDLSALFLIDRLGSLSDDERETLRSVVADELVETGLGPDDEPNARGKVLEDLIDRLGRL